jgi:hypothetical protein
MSLTLARDGGVDKVKATRKVRHKVLRGAVLHLRFHTVEEIIP